MPDFVQTAPYDPSAGGVARGMVRKFSTRHDILWIAWRMLRWLVLHPLALAGIVAGAWLWIRGLPFWLALVAAFAPHIAKADKSQVGVFASALRRRSLRQSLIVLSNWWRIRRGWSTGTRKIGFSQPGRGGQIPWLRHWELTSAGLSATVTCGVFGWSADELAGRAQTIAAGIKKCRAVMVTQGEFPGVARVDFAFADPLADIIPITDLAVPPRGRLSVGLTERGDPAYLWSHLGILVVGLPGSGKSNMLWTVVASALASGEPFKLWVMDPAGGVELWELSNGSPLVHRYAAKPEDMRALVRELHTAMMRRMEAMAGRERVHTPTATEPRWFLVIDEMLKTYNSLGKHGNTNYTQLFVEILSMCRKAAITPIALTQIPFGHSIGEQVRILFPQKVVFRANDFMVTNSVFGGGSEALGAAASKIPIKTPGVGYMILDTETRPAKFRGPLITDPMASLVARGILPDGVPTAVDARVAKDNRPHVLYRWDNPRLVPVCRYVGISFDGAQRAMQHLSDAAKAELREPGVTMSIVEQFTVESHAGRVAEGLSVREIAEAAERDMIRALEPPLNIAHNGARRRSRKAVTAG